MNHLSLDLYTLHLINLVAKHRGFTAASTEAGITQSALTRQVKGAEDRLGFSLFHRTTREVTITEEGAILLRETRSIPNILNNAIRRINEEYLDAVKEIKIGISREITTAHIPGIFHHNSREETKILISESSEQDLIRQLEDNEIDIALISKSGHKTPLYEIQHTIQDHFCVIASRAQQGMDNFKEWACAQRWLLPPSHTSSRILIDEWALNLGLDLNCSMEIENFDLINQLVMLDLGVAFTPLRSLSHTPRKYKLQKVKLPSKLSRELIVASQKDGKTPDYIASFVDKILFS